jgi:hypothetical protein
MKHSSAWIEDGSAQPANAQRPHLGMQVEHERLYFSSGSYLLNYYLLTIKNLSFLSFL